MIQAVQMMVEAWREGDFPADEWQFVDATGAAIDITGWTIWFYVSRDESSLAAPLLSLSSTASNGDRVSIDGASNGNWRPVIAAATLAGLPLIPSADPRRPGTQLFCAVAAQPSGGIKEIYASGLFVVRG